MNAFINDVNIILKSKIVNASIGLNEILRCVKMFLSKRDHLSLV